MRMMLLAFLLALLPTLAVCGEAKLDVGGEVVLAPKAKEAQWQPAAAFDGKDAYLVVWSEGTGLWGGEADIHGARVKSDGAVLDAEPLVICKAKDFQKEPAVAWTGSEWLVVWQDMRDGKGYDVYATRVSGDGKVLDPDGFAVCTEKGDQVLPAVASDGKGNALVVWSDARVEFEYDIWGAAVASGKATGPVALVKEKGVQMGPSAAWLGKHYLVGTASRAGKANLVARVGADGKPLDDKARPLGWGGPSGMNTVMAAAGERAYLVTRGESGKVYDPNMLWANLLDSEGAGVATENPGRQGFGTPTNAPVSPAPDRLSSPSTNGQSELWHHGVGSDGERFLVVFEAAGNGFLVLVPAKTGRIEVEVPLAGAPSPVLNPTVAGGRPGEFLVVYENDKAAGDHKICARLVKVK